MLKLSKLATSLLAGIFFSASVMAAEKAFVTVNGVGVPTSLVNVLVAEQRAQGAQESPEFMASVREEMIRRALILEQAKKAKLDKNPAVAAQVETARQKVLISAYIQDYARAHPISEALMQRRYDEIKTQVGNTEYKLRHILVATENEAAGIITELKQGSKFEDLVKKSIDPSAKTSNGDLGWNNPTNFVKPFGEALVQLKKGEYTVTPVRTEYGFHVIQLEDTRPLSIPTFEELKPRLEQQLQAQNISRMVDELRQKAKVQ
ncbi:MAG: peptidylprolyl isomerase [Candidatus Accumulibacter sp.]|jgi:peptidyl-prolyl cis-trans isomerase C|nr:peptidylprolyl isomerase [Accumulibacter sp.]